MIYNYQTRKDKNSFAYTIIKIRMVNKRRISYDCTIRVYDDPKTKTTIGLYNR